MVLLVGACLQATSFGRITLAQAPKKPLMNCGSLAGKLLLILLGSLLPIILQAPSGKRGIAEIQCKEEGELYHFGNTALAQHHPEQCEENRQRENDEQCGAGTQPRIQQNMVNVAAIGLER